MKKLVLLTAVLAGACQADTRNLERKLEAMDKKLDAIAASGGGRGGAAGAGQARAPRPEPDRAKTYAVPIDGNPFDGPADAKVTMIKAYDYACGFCEKTRDTMAELHKKFGNDLRVVYKQLVIHPKNAMVGALAFCAAAKQGKHKEMDALIWDKGFKSRQLDLTDVPLNAAEKPADPAARPSTVKCWDHPDGCKNVYGYANELQLNLDKFKADMKECQATVQNDGKVLAQFGLSSTPAFFINGRYVSGAQSVDVFSAVINDELDKANKAAAAGTPAAAYYQKVVMGTGLKSLEAPKQ